jgi:hypothetical protein
MSDAKPVSRVTMIYGQSAELSLVNCLQEIDNAILSCAAQYAQRPINRCEDRAAAAVCEDV